MSNSSWYQGPQKTVILTLFIYAKTVNLSFLYLKFLMSGTNMILILWNFETLYRDTLWNFHNNDVVPPGHKMLIPCIFVGLDGVLLLAQNLYLSLLKN